MQALPIDIEIMKYINRHGNVFGQNCYASYARIAEAVGVTRRYVMRRCQWLEQQYILRIERRKNPLNRRGNLVNVFSIVRKWLRELSYHDAYMAKQRRRLAQQKDTAHLGNGTRAKPPSENTHQTRERTRNPEQFLPQWERIETRQQLCQHPSELRSKAGDENTMCLKCYALLTDNASIEG
jgi:hypothetical protein